MLKLRVIYLGCKTLWATKNRSWNKDKQPTWNLSKIFEIVSAKSAKYRKQRNPSVTVVTGSYNQWKQCPHYSSWKSAGRYCKRDGGSAADVYQPTVENWRGVYAKDWWCYPRKRSSQTRISASTSGERRTMWKPLEKAQCLNNISDYNFNLACISFIQSYNTFCNFDFVLHKYTTNLGTI